MKASSFPTPMSRIIEKSDYVDDLDEFARKNGLAITPTSVYVRKMTQDDFDEVVASTFLGECNSVAKAIQQYFLDIDSKNLPDRLRKFGERISIISAIASIGAMYRVCYSSESTSGSIKLGNFFSKKDFSKIGDSYYLILFSDSQKAITLIGSMVSCSENSEIIEELVDAVGADVDKLDFHKLGRYTPITEGGFTEDITSAIRKTLDTVVSDMSLAGYVNGSKLMDLPKEFLEKLDNLRESAEALSKEIELRNQLKDKWDMNAVLGVISGYAVPMLDFDKHFESLKTLVPFSQLEIERMNFQRNQFGTRKAPE